MNSRSSVNEKNLVNFSADLSTLNPLESKEALLSFPFDHIYACHSESADRRQTLQLEKEVEISTHCVVAEDKELVVSAGSEINRLTARLTASENQNKRLKDLLIYHLDLIQQQNDHITKRDKLYQALKHENDTLKSKVTRMEKKVAVNHRQSVNPPPLVHVPSSSVTSTVVKSEPHSAAPIILNSFTELLLPFDSNSNTTKIKSYSQDSFDINRSSETDVTNYLGADLGVTSILDSNINCNNFTMIENKRSFVKKELKTENRTDALYTVASNSGNPVIQRLQRNRRRTSSGLGSLTRLSKSPATKLETAESSKVFEDHKSYERSFSVNKKSKMINTYGKSRGTTKRTSQFTGSLSDRLQLIDTTPTGEDPYQLGEADMREQSPIPKLMLQKTNHGRMKVCTDTLGESTTKRVESTITTPKVKEEKYNIPSTYVHPSELDSPKTLIVNDPDLDLVKTEPEIDWRVYSPGKEENEPSLCDFSYGENPNNLASHILPSLDAMEFQELFSSESPLNLDTFTPVDYNPGNDKSISDRTKKRTVRTTSLLGPNIMEDDSLENKRGLDANRGRKRALSTTGLFKAKRDNMQPKAITAKPKLMRGGKASYRGKKSPIPGMISKKPYHTLVGDPDLSWYLGLDPDVKLEDVELTEDTKVSTVEVPRWREKPYTSCYTMEGTENLDDKIFEKRHQKLEAEERRQLRWHMRRVREQRQMERLRLRQRDPWGGGASPARAPPSVYSVWPRPQPDLQLLEITDTLPVTAFGEILPDLPRADFMLPWVRTSKALKRSKRSKTLL